MDKLCNVCNLRFITSECSGFTDSEFISLHYWYDMFEGFAGEIYTTAIHPADQYV